MARLCKVGAAIVVAIGAVIVSYAVVMLQASSLTDTERAILVFTLGTATLLIGLSRLNSAIECGDEDEV